MTKEISDKNNVLVTRSLGRFYLNDAQATKIKTLLDGGIAARVDMDGNTIMLNDVAGIVTGDQIEQTDRVKKGDWRCKHGEWHSRNQECGHGMLER